MNAAYCSNNLVRNELVSSSHLEDVGMRAFADLYKHSFEVFKCFKQC